MTHNPHRIADRLDNLHARHLATLTATHVAINRAIGLIGLLAVAGVGLVLL